VSARDAAPRPAATRSGLRADCARCQALCCVAPALTASADFAIDKAAGVPCPHLDADCSCTIHARLRERGFPGCATYDCFGAGQRICAGSFRCRSWRAEPDVAAQMFAAFAELRRLHELLWYLEDAIGCEEAASLRARLVAMRALTGQLAGAGGDELAAGRNEQHHRDADRLLRAASELVRSAAPDGPALAGCDLIEADLRDADLRGADLHGAYLLGADLRKVDLGHADVMGADLRAADLRGARLERALYVTQPQINAAHGDAATRLPPWLTRPTHWTGAP